MNLQRIVKVASIVLSVGVVTPASPKPSAGSTAPAKTLSSPSAAETPQKYDTSHAQPTARDPKDEVKPSTPDASAHSPITQQSYGSPSTTPPTSYPMDRASAEPPPAGPSEYGDELEPPPSSPNGPIEGLPPQDSYSGNGDGGAIWPDPMEVAPNPHYEAHSGGFEEIPPPPMPPAGDAGPGSYDATPEEP